MGSTSLVPVMPSVQAKGLVTLFLPDSEPISLEASAIAVNTVGRDPVTTLQVACPTAASPENDACRSAGIYPAQVYHTQGPVWGGTTTYSVDDSTTTWVCTLGGSNPKLSGECTKTIVSSGSTRTETAEYGNCYVVAHQRPIVVTAGGENINSRHYLEMDASQYVSLRSRILAEDGCPASQTTIWAGAAASTTATSGATTGASSTGSSPTTTTPQSQTQTGSAPAATSTSSGAGRAGKNAMVAVLVGMGLSFILGLM
ncbi:hypothetical protein N657DRAFT_649494 [Parathielavia appendiculata]|uniref:Uncharacterized protein n=1 Tax=Parathielavia appendiculata TaxID=2587402 RepID=A0AAN6YZN4_9PEZI|nr:hypothetical protein N657DRAFT_649494 [Parathielavia appendiculata]